VNSELGGVAMQLEVYRCTAAKQLFSRFGGLQQRQMVAHPAHQLATASDGSRPCASAVRLLKGAEVAGYAHMSMWRHCQGLFIYKGKPRIEILH
jgi:hypothetical protein